MLDDQRTPTTTTSIASSSSINSRGEVPDDDATEIRDIHALTSPSTSRAAARRRESWEAGSHRSSSLSVASDIENFSTMSREFSALVVAGSTMQDTPTDSIVSSSTDLITSTLNNNNSSNSHNNLNLARIGEEELLEETNPLAIVPDSNPIPSPRRPNHNINNNNNNRNNNSASGNSMMIGGPSSSSCEDEVVSVHMVKKEEVESKIAAWQTAEIAKINNRFKREDVVINGWESEQVEKATSCLKKVERKLDEQRARAVEKMQNDVVINGWESEQVEKATSCLKKVERKLDEQRARAVEKMQNDVAKARRKAEEKRASAEAKRGTKVARILEMSNLLRAVGRAPSKRSFF